MKRILAVDPGRRKCGLAVAGSDGELLFQRVIPCLYLAEELAAIRIAYDPDLVLLGNGTASRDVAAVLRRSSFNEIIYCDEKGTTLEARARFFDDHPPRGLLKLLPRSFLLPGRDYDDYVAIILIERYLGQRLSPAD